jgi:hypothetical protein
MEKWKEIFEGTKFVSEDLLLKLEEMIQPYLTNLEKAKVYKTKEKKEVISENREGWKTIIESPEIHSFLEEHLMPYIQHHEYEFEILPSHFDYMEYETGGHFAKHIDFVSSHTNFTKQYTCILGLETCKTGDTMIWNSEFNDYLPTSQSIHRGGLVWFQSELSHFADKFKDKEKKKRIFTFSLRAMKKNELNPELCKWISKEGNVHLIKKTFMKDTFVEKILESEDHFQTDFSDDEIKLIFDYLQKTRILSIGEMNKIREKLAFLMMLQPEFMNDEVPSKHLQEMNEKWKHQDFVVFNEFEPWMTEWANKNDLIPFQMICHWNDFTMYFQYDLHDQQFGYDRHQIMKRVFPRMQHYQKQNYTEMANMLEHFEPFHKSYRYNEPEFDEHYQDIEEDRLLTKSVHKKFQKEREEKEDVMNEHWLNADYVVTMGNMKYLEGDGYLAKLCQKMNEKEVFEKKSLMNKMKNLVHFHQYNIFQNVLEKRYEKFVKRAASRNYTYGYFKKHKKREFIYGESKSDLMCYNREDDFSVSDCSIYDYRNRDSISTDSSESLSTDSDSDLGDKLLNLFQSIEKKQITFMNTETNEEVDMTQYIDTTDNESSEETFIREDSISSNEDSTSSDEEIKVVDLKKQRLEEESDEEPEELSPDSKVIQLHLTQEEEESEADEEVMNGLWENASSTDSSSSYSSGSFEDLYEKQNLPSLHGMETIHSDDPRISKANMNEEECNVYMQRFHDVHFKKFTESFEEREISKEDQERIQRAVREISLHEAYNFRDHIFERYYDESCNEGDETFYHYKFKVYYVYYGFLRPKSS